MGIVNAAFIGIFSAAQQSFGGARRPYAEQVAGALRARGARWSYAADEQIEPPGVLRKSGRQRGITAGRAPSYR